MPGLFITGTDTNVGKTWVTGHLAKHLAKTQSVVTQKWVQTGSLGFSEDIQEHWRIMGTDGAEYTRYKKAMVPYTFSLPASPHLAAENEGQVIDPNKLTTAYAALCKHFSWVLVEGAGGFLTPLNRQHTLADSVEKLKLPTLIVVENKLGAINHTLLTIEALKSRRIPIVGIVMNNREENLITEDNGRIIQELSGVLTLEINTETVWDTILQALNLPPKLTRRS